VVVMKQVRNSSGHSLYQTNESSGSTQAGMSLTVINLLTKRVGI